MSTGHKVRRTTRPTCHVPLVHFSSDQIPENSFHKSSAQIPRVFGLQQKIKRLGSSERLATSLGTSKVAEGQHGNQEEPNPGHVEHGTSTGLIQGTSSDIINANAPRANKKNSDLKAHFRMLAPRHPTGELDQMLEHPA